MTLTSLDQFQPLDEDYDDVFAILDEDFESFLAPVSSISKTIYAVDSLRIDKKNSSRKYSRVSLIRERFSGYFKMMSRLFEKIAKGSERRVKMAGNLNSLTSKRETAVLVIQELWRRRKIRKVFLLICELLIELTVTVSSAGEILRWINPLEAELMDRASGSFIRLRLTGQTFPPIIVYKIFTKRPVIDLSSTELRLLEFRDGDPPRRRETSEKIIPRFDGNSVGGSKYVRVDGNDWRPFLASKIIPESTIDRKRRTRLCEGAIPLSRGKSGRRSNLAMIKRLYEESRNRRERIARAK